ncbi:hypothetical protein U1Q18_019378 [Sarracenia purpurea var. burkii]
MGVAKAWRFTSGFLSKLALVVHQQNKQHFLCKSSSSAQRRPVSWSLVCGLMLFALGLISLFTGHVASDLEWYSQRLVKRSFYYKLVQQFHSAQFGVSYCGHFNYEWCGAISQVNLEWL